MKLLMLSAGCGRYAVPADAVTRIMDSAGARELRAGSTSGVPDRAGEAIPVFDLRGPAGGADPAGGVYLLVEREGGVALVAADDAEAIREVPGADIAPLPSFIFSGASRIFRGLFSDGRSQRLLVDPGDLR
jgi:chemotaxis signal transduction protein